MSLSLNMLFRSVSAPLLLVFRTPWISWLNDLNLNNSIDAWKCISLSCITCSMCMCYYCTELLWLTPIDFLFFRYSWWWFPFRVLWCKMFWSQFLGLGEWLGAWSCKNFCIFLDLYSHMFPRDTLKLFILLGMIAKIHKDLWTLLSFWVSIACTHIHICTWHVHKLLIINEILLK